MGSNLGYEYRHRFSMVDASDINSELKSIVFKDNARNLVFEFRTSFTIKKRVEDEAVVVVVDTEVFDRCVPENSCSCRPLSSIEFSRLYEYWMTMDEVHSLADEAFAFAKGLVDRDPQLASPLAFVVDLEVCTAQREGETFEACVERAITPHNLPPLYLWCPRAHKPPRLDILTRLFLRQKIERMRVEDVDEGLALMPVCPICRSPRGTPFGGQISLLECQHAFHSHCVLRVLANNCDPLDEYPKCPLCHHIDF